MVEFKRGVYEMALTELSRYLPRNDNKNRFLRQGRRGPDAAGEFRIESQETPAMSLGDALPLTTNADGQQ